MSVEKMRMVQPVAVTPDNLVSSNVAENDYPAWDSVTAYDADDWVIDDHSVYQAVSANTNKKPADNPDVWTRKSTTNRYLMFDDKIGSRTTNADSIDVVIGPEQAVTDLGILNAFANQIVVTMTDPDEGEVYSKTVGMVGNDVQDWWEYFFEPVTRRSDLVLTGLPAYPSATIEIAATVETGDTAAIGHVVIGTGAEIGWVNWGTSLGIKDFSVKEQDEFGNYVLVERDYSDRIEFDVSIERAKVYSVRKMLAQYRATPVLWIGHSQFEETVAFGPYRDFLIVMSNPALSECTITVEGFV